MDDNENNALCYLMVSNPPTPDPQAVTYSGQWVDVNNHMATYVLNRSLLWPWMHTVLRDVVIAMIPAPITPILYWDNTDHEHPYACGMRYEFGDSTATDNDYQFLPSAANQWTWTGRSLHTDARVANPRDWNDYETITEDCNLRKSKALSM